MYSCKFEMGFKDGVEEKWWRGVEYKWRMEGEWMRGNTHSDTRETFSHHQARRQLAVSQPPISSQDLLVVGPPNLIIVVSIALSSCKHSTTTRGGKKKRIESRRRETRIYMPLGNLYGISLSCAIVYCVWLSNEKNGKEKGWAGCWAIKAAFRVVACQHGCLYALTNLVMRTHNHPFTQAQRHSSAYTSNSGEGPNHTYKGQFTLGHTGIHWY